MGLALLASLPVSEINVIAGIAASGIAGTMALPNVRRRRSVT